MGTLARNELITKSEFRYFTQVTNVTKWHEIALVFQGIAATTIGKRQITNKQVIF